MCITYIVCHKAIKYITFFTGMIIIGVVTTPQDHFTKVWTEFWSHATGINAFSLVCFIRVQ